jgi:EAL domain-containing protein (putative c-di-GMP-specific phosphodiesterase class I)
VLYGWTEDEVRGQLIGDVIGWGNEGESLEAAAIQLLETGAWRGTARQLKRDGSTVLVDASTSIIKSQDGDAVAVVSVNRELWPASNNSTTVAGVAEVTADLERALAADEIVVHYQPVVRLDDGSIVKVEALVRWQHPVLGLLPPARFMAAAEDSGIIVALGERVLIKACEAVAEYRRMKDPNLELAVNLSARQLTDPTLVKSVQAALDATGLPADALWLEVTETAVIEHTDHGIHALMALRDLGVRLAIDDFGTGHASLNYLKRLPVQMLKIDRSFVSAVGQDRFDTAIVRSVLGLAQELGLVVVAEGVETREQADALAAMGCELCQGFLYCRPVPANALPETCGDR